ncbi:hypothetical protein F511_21406 [Dorcoceras hygrometricum]|uniref:Uncharacterized protein n=1 Tax=Dorcoceras hygrometricum TaxID=472368 RepID=A0A2Z7DAP7_9LAMI|nr:hypothetical protein F511_21406 [Dorcoceras hygrometricum]
MRSVVASHGPGSNPRDNAICNAILLQSFPVLQIFGLQYLDRHRPPSSNVLPLNLAQKLKISKSIKKRARHRIPARKLHGLPGAGPNQTLEEFRPAFTTSSETRRSGGRPAAPPRKTCAPQGRTRFLATQRHRCHRRARRRAWSRNQRARDSNSTAIVRNISRGRPASMRRNGLHEGGSSAAEASAHDCAKWPPDMRDKRGGDARQARLRHTTSAAEARVKRAWGAMRRSISYAQGTARAHCGRYRQSGPRPEPRLLRQPALEALMNSARMDSPRRVGRKRIFGDDGRRRRTAGGGGGLWERGGAAQFMVLGVVSSVRDTASRGPTTIVAPESQFRTCPTDHGKASSNIAP